MSAPQALRQQSSAGDTQVTPFRRYVLPATAAAEQENSSWRIFCRMTNQLLPPFHIKQVPSHDRVQEFMRLFPLGTYYCSPCLGLPQRFVSAHLLHGGLLAARPRARRLQPRRGVRDRGALGLHAQRRLEVARREPPPRRPDPHARRRPCRSRRAVAARGRRHCRVPAAAACSLGAPSKAARRQ